MPYPAIFLDRDGTLIEDLGHAWRPEQIRILGGTASGLARLANAGYKLVVVTNQSGIARGLFSEEDLTRFHEALDRQLNLLGVRIDAYYVCPHYPDRAAVVRQELAVDCQCRKPHPGMILRAAEDLHLDLASSWLLGDSWRDVQAGQAAGLRTVKLPPAPGTSKPRPPEVQPPTAEASNLDEAAGIVLGLRAPAPLPEAPPAAEAPPPAAPPQEEPAPLATEGPAEEPPPPPTEHPREEPPAPVGPSVAAVAGTCGRCGVDIPQADVDAGVAGGDDGGVLCAECLRQRGRTPPAQAPDGTADLLREVLMELRRQARLRQAPSLSFLRLLAYLLQAAALFFAIAMPFIIEWKMPEQDKMISLQIAIILQLLVVTLLVLERKS